MPTQVDWWQVQNVPPGAGQQFDDLVMGGGPWQGSPLVFDDTTGIRVSSGPFVQLLPASLTQTGVISQFGAQQLQGPFWIYQQGVSLLAPSILVPGPALGLLGGGLAFWDVLDSTSAAPPAYLSWFDDGLGSGDCTLESVGRIKLTSSGGSSNTMSLTSGTAGLFLTDGSSVGGSRLSDATQITLAPSTATLTVGVDSGLAPFCDLNQTSGLANPYYVVGGHAGAFGFLVDGSFVNGGIITFIPGIPVVSWSAITGTPTTFAGYGLTTPILPGDAAGGDLSGTYPNPTVSQIDGFPLAIASPAINDTLIWNGTDWVNSPAAGGGIAIGEAVSGGTAQAVLFVDSSDNLADDHHFSWTPGGVPTLTITDSGPEQVTIGGDGSIITQQGSGWYVSLGVQPYALLAHQYVSGNAAAIFEDAAGHTVSLCDGTNNVSYTPSTPGDWSPVPTDVWPALDQLAARIPSAGLAIGDAIGSAIGGGVLFESSGGTLDDNANFTYSPTVGVMVVNGVYEAFLANSGYGIGAADIVNQAYLCDGSHAVYAAVGPIEASGTAGNTFQWSAGHAVPATTQTGIPPATYYGQSGGANWMGEPDAWCLVNVGGTDYLLPLYLP